MRTAFSNEKRRRPSPVQKGMHIIIIVISQCSYLHGGSNTVIHDMFNLERTFKMDSHKICVVHREVKTNYEIMAAISRWNMVPPIPV